MAENEVKPPETEVVEAGHVYLLMKKEYRISRNIRAAWFFKHLNTNLDFIPDKPLDEHKDELSILSILPKEPIKITPNNDKKYRYRLTPSTIVTFLARKYRFVFALDLSPSVACVDIKSGDVLISQAFKALKNVIRGIVQSFCIPACNMVYKPLLYVTVIAYTPLVSPKIHQVLVQGYILTRNNVEEFLAHVHHLLDRFENCCAMKLAEMFDDEDDQIITGGLFDDLIERPESPKEAIKIITPDAGFVNMLRYSILALQLLPENSSAGIVVITDGRISVPDTMVFEGLMSQLRRSTVACSFVQISDNNPTSCGFGDVPYTELMQFIATATFGAYLASSRPVVESEDKVMNVFHRALFTWNFQKGLEGFKIDNLKHNTSDEFSEDLAVINRRQLSPDIDKPIQTYNCDMPMLRKTHCEAKYAASIFSLMYVRLREGYTIKDVIFSKNETQLEVHLLLPWSHNAKVEYIASSAWPLTSGKHTHVEIVLEGSYDFLHDVTWPRKIPIKSTHRIAVFKKFWQYLQGLSQTDHLLVHLQSFPLNSSNYSVPESIKNGMPLFYLPPNSANIQLSIQQSSKDTLLSQFASYWKPVVMLDINIWQKWMHTHRIGIILEHDLPLPKYLHVPNSSGRYNGVQCRQALTALNNLLRDWSTFVLMENHSYIKFLYSEPEKPESFYLIRWTGKSPCIVLRLAFMGGTPGHKRNEIVNELKSKISNLVFPQRGPTKDEKTKSLMGRRRSVVSREIKRPPLQRAWSEICCCILLDKPVEKMLLRYERVPRSFLTIDDGGTSYPSYGAHYHQNSQSKAASSMFTALSRYHHHHRWIWSIQNTSHVSITMQAVGRVLSTLAKIRLQEGFNFAHAASGIVNLVLELQMKSNVADSCSDTQSNNETTDDSDMSGCVMQYVIFPPFINTVRSESMSEDELLDDEPLESTEADGQLQIITECWIEPQCGIITDTVTEQDNFNGLHYWEIPKALFPVDYECVSNMVTFEHLSSMCQIPSIESPTIHRFVLRAKSQTNSQLSQQHDISITNIPFTFDLMSIIQKSQQVEMLFSTFIQDDLLGMSGRSTKSPRSPRQRHHSLSLDQASTNNTLFDLLFEKLEQTHDKQLPLSQLECAQFLQALSDRDRVMTDTDLPFTVPTSIESFIEANILQPVETAIPDLLAQRQCSVVSTDTVHSMNSLPSPFSTSNNEQMWTKLKTQMSDHSDSDSKKDHHQSGASSSAIQSKTVHISNPIPKWSCFLKLVTETTLMLTMLPSTFQDLQTLMNYESNEIKTEDLKSVGETVAGVGSLDISQLKDGEATPKVLSAPPSPEKLIRQEKVDSETEESENTELDDKVASTDKNVPPLIFDRLNSDLVDRKPKLGLKLPVYVYYMSLGRITRHLENAGNIDLPDDQYQDHTFKPDESRNETNDDLDDRSKTDENNDRWRRSPERGSIDDTLSSSGFDLKQHCNCVADSYFKSFVIGVFKSLQLGLPVDPHDIDSAINNICEESSPPLEIDVTQFIQTVCGHTRSVIEKSRLDAMMKEEYLVTLQKLPLDDDSKSSMSDTSIDQRDPSSNVGHQAISFPLSSLQTDTAACEAKKGIHVAIKSKFDAILRKSFKSIPGYQDYFFYCPPNYQQDVCLQEESESRVCDDAGNTTGDCKGITTEESDYFVSDLELDDVKASDKDSVKSNLDTESMGSILDNMESSFSNEEEDELPPLFIHMTCSVSYCNKTGVLASQSVKTIPCCLSELDECVASLGSDLDLSNSQVTLDIFCLTLHTSNVDNASNRRRSEFRRLTSYDAGSPTHSDIEERESCLASTDAAFSLNHMGQVDRLKNLPSFQHQSVIDCIEQIKWLLSDEIASAMHYIMPVNTDMLEFVARHVIDSKDWANCTHEDVSLQFVFGPDHSLAKFVEEFERMDLTNYTLCKEGVYYYLQKTRKHTNSTIHRTIQSLAELSNDRTPDDSPKTDASEKPAKQNESFIVIGPNDSTTPGEETDKESAKVDQEGFKMEDIVISLTRPSPAREQSQVAPDLEYNLSDAASDSSIKILETPDIVSKESKTEQLPIGLIKAEIERTSTPILDSGATGGSDRKSPPLNIAPVSDELLTISSLPEADQSQSPEDKRPKTLDIVLNKALSSEIVMRSEDSKSSQSSGHTSDTGTPSNKEVRRALSYPDEKGNTPKPTISAPIDPVDGSTSKVKEVMKVRARMSSSDSVVGARRGSGGSQTPIRQSSRHASGTSENTPHRHPSGGSQTSGYDGDSSDSEGEPAPGPHVQQYRHALNFWLIMRVAKDKVDIYFHTSRSKTLLPIKRESGDLKTDVIVQQKTLYNKMISNIKDTCRRVNQMLLLEGLNESKICNRLLVPEADEDIWKDELTYPTRSRSVAMGLDSDEEDQSEGPQKNYLAASMQFMPGHFACQCMWQYHFVLHPRLKTGPGRTGMSRGFQALRSVLNPFSVANRKNMFVIKETTENVFYIRLNESMCEVKPLAGMNLEPSDQPETGYLIGSRSSSMLSLATRRATEVDDDTHDVSHDGLSCSSSSFRAPITTSHKRVEESVTLSVHGITNAGPEIRSDLVQVLQNRLDEAVLDVITVMLSRNPMCKLTPDDVQFIQTPFTDPKETVRYTIPSAASLYLYALGYYLRQNLLQVIQTPKYADNRAECHFQDYTKSKPVELPENDVFIYNRPTSSGGKGLACIHLSLVDGRGNPVQLLCTAKPQLSAYKDSFEAPPFDVLTSASRYSESPAKNKPGPTALIQFRIWERGDVDIKQLIDKLYVCLQHATCDIIMEYRFLTAPICDVPIQYPARSQDVPFYSAPPSPMKGIQFANVAQPLTPTTLYGAPLEDQSHWSRLFSRMKASGGLHTRRPTITAETAALKGPTTPGPGPPRRAGDKTPKEKTSPVTFGKEFLEALKGKTTQVETSPNWQDMEAQRRREVERRQQIQRFENGETGMLSRIHHMLMEEWFEFCIKLGVPSMYKIQMTLQSRHSVDFVLREIQNIVNSICSDTVVKLFQGVQRNSDMSFHPYMPVRISGRHHSGEKKPQPLDLPHSRSSPLPGSHANFFGIGRNVRQWRHSIEYTDIDDEDGVSLTNPKTHKSFQRYQPFDSTPPGGDLSSLSIADKTFIPRQRFLLLETTDKLLTVYTYNWASDLVTNLERRVEKLIEWHISRDTLLTNIISQKLGLFQHHINVKEPNPYNSNMHHEFLIRSAAPPLRDLSRTSHGSRPSSGGGQPFHELLWDNHPKKRLHNASYGNSKDPVYKHGLQILETRNSEKRDSEKRLKLEKLYVLWQQRSGHSHVPIAEDVLELLKQSSRLIHYVATPFLFSPQWRKRVVARIKTYVPSTSYKPLSLSTPTLSATVTEGKRSRHSSGSSIKKVSTGIQTSSPDVSRRRRTSRFEEGWHIDLRSSMIQQYIQYLQSIGFIQIQTRPPSPKRTRKSSGTAPNPEKIHQTQPHSQQQKRKHSYEKKLQDTSNLYHLQKAILGGIILVEIGFRDVYFCVKLYAFECTKIPVVKSSVSPQMAMFFTDECDKFKDLIHVHSFAHDFHLRTAQAYIGGRQNVFKADFHLSSFLADFIKYYPRPPNFSRNYAFNDTLVVLSPSSAPHQLFEYMLNHDKLYKMRAIKMLQTQIPEDDIVDFDYALVSQSYHVGCMEEIEGIHQKTEDYDVGLVFTLNTPMFGRLSDLDRSILKLKYFLLLSSKRELFPKLTAEKKTITLQVAPGSKRFPADKEDASPEPGSKSATTTNYLGYSNMHQTPLYTVMKQEAFKAKARIQTMVDNTMAQCRRDILWDRTLVGDRADEERLRRKRNTNDSDEARDTYLTKLSFTEFEEMLGMVYKEPLKSMDKRLLPLTNMPLAWYQGLIRVLVNKYPETHRNFTSADNLVQYLAVLNPNYLDTFILVSVDGIHKTADLSAVYKEETSGQFHTPSQPNIPALSMQTHIEGFINACCYHLWSGIVSP
ncbi:KICSTOR complex protein SZT2-like [Tubulanus polymorphus]|uniref:KICSTOR complex protein SZT2-like n=1 Tax=Tubulanus polymorphus TaxID=672921 RepID=UPI003DA24194